MTFLQISYYTCYPICPYNFVHNTITAIPTIAKKPICTMTNFVRLNLFASASYPSFKYDWTRLRMLIASIQKIVNQKSKIANIIVSSQPLITNIYSNGIS